MNTAIIRQQLHSYLEKADDKKVQTIYVMVEDEINGTPEKYSNKFKAELDHRVEYYLNGGKMIAPTEMHKRLQTIRKKRKKESV